MILGKSKLLDLFSTGAWKAFRSNERMNVGEISQLLNPNSMDVTLGFSFLKCSSIIIDPLSDNIDWVEECGPIHLKPGQFVLGSVRERIECNEPVTIAGRDRLFYQRIDGKSTIGRLGISVHITAGFGDYGFQGAFTLEIKNEHPESFVKLYPGMRIAQIVFDEVYMPVCYEGAYSKENHFNGPVSPVISKSRLFDASED